MSGYCESCKFKIRNVPMGKLKQIKTYDESTNTIITKYCFDCKICCPQINCWCNIGQEWSESLVKKN
jgi:hypothetical protein